MLTLDIDKIMTSLSGALDAVDHLSPKEKAYRAVVLDKLSGNEGDKASWVRLLRLENNRSNIAYFGRFLSGLDVRTEDILAASSDDASALVPPSKSVPVKTASFVSAVPSQTTQGEENIFVSWMKEQSEDWESSFRSLVAAKVRDEDDDVGEHVLAQQSLVEHEGVASEALAVLHAQQGNIEKAISMYERLSLKKPEKSAYFAAKILELKNK